MNMPFILPFRPALLWFACAALCSTPLLASAAATAKAGDTGLDELQPAPLLQPRTPGTLPAGKKFLPASNNMTLGARNPEAGSRLAGREVAYDLAIEYRDGTIYNPSTGKHDKVHLRSYNHDFTAPTVVMLPGQTARFNLMNQLPPEHPTNTEPAPVPFNIIPKSGPNCLIGAANTPASNGCFNSTNLHSHGLWVSPTGNSDNVLLNIKPDVNFEYEYNVPADHPTGTFWYHPHMHGSTAMQVGSGMAGALVVKGDRLPTKDSNGDLDVLLKPFEPPARGKNPGGTAEEVKLFAQIPYACFDAQGNPKTERPVDPKDSQPNPWVCAADDTGVVENFDVQVGNPSGWSSSARYTSINGQTRPGISLEAGRVYRWRMIDAGFNETIQLRIRKISKNTGDLTKGEIKRLCDGDDVTQFEVASDGLTHNNIIARTTTVLQPGYRSDILFTLPEKGLYCVYNDNGSTTSTTNLTPEEKELARQQSLNAGRTNPQVLAVIVARGEAKVADQAGFLQSQLTTSAKNLALAAEVKAIVLADLKDKNHMKLSKFVPHAPITEKEITESGQNPVYIDFNLTFGAGVPTEFLINNSAYKSDRIDQTLVLGTAQTWFLSTKSVNHPFHIHVNPFEIISINKKTCTDPKGKTTQAGCVGEPSDDPQYKNLVGTFKDTLFVTQDVIIQTRTRYERYIGQYVLHCHILEHEDQGMMQNVEVVLPNGNGGGQKAGHH